jgi:molybdate transport system regulatory protein
MQARTSPAPHVRIRVDFAPGCSVGPGKVSLLEAIESEGSLTLAARLLAMSYRRAWNLLDDLNQSFAAPMVETAVGGKSGGGARLTDSGRALIRVFRDLERGTERLAARRMKEFSPRRARHASGRATPLSPRGRPGR